MEMDFKNKERINRNLKYSRIKSATISSSPVASSPVGLLAEVFGALVGVPWVEGLTQVAQDVLVQELLLVCVVGVAPKHVRHLGGGKCLRDVECFINYWIIRYRFHITKFLVRGLCG